MHSVKTGIATIPPAPMASAKVCAARSTWQRCCRPPRIHNVKTGISSKPPARMAPARSVLPNTVLPITVTASGMPRLACWLRMGAMLYAGSVTAALIAGTVLWPW